jgi:hypothetical protein
MSCKTVERSAQTRDVPRATVADARIPRVAVQHSSGGEYSADSVGIAPADERIPCKIGRKVSTDEKDSTYDRRGNECCHQTVRRSFASECSADAVGFDRSGRMKSVQCTARDVRPSAREDAAATGGIARSPQENATLEVVNLRWHGFSRCASNFGAVDSKGRLCEM